MLARLLYVRSQVAIAWSINKLYTHIPRQVSQPFLRTQSNIMKLLSQGYKLQPSLVWFLVILRNGKLGKPIHIKRCSIQALCSKVVGDNLRLGGNLLREKRHPLDGLRCHCSIWTCCVAARLADRMRAGLSRLSRGIKSAYLYIHCIASGCLHPSLLFCNRVL